MTEIGGVVDTVAMIDRGTVVILCIVCHYQKREMLFLVLMI